MHLHHRPPRLSKQASLTAKSSGTVYSGPSEWLVACGVVSIKDMKSVYPSVDEAEAFASAETFSTPERKYGFKKVG